MGKIRSNSEIRQEWAELDKTLRMWNRVEVVESRWVQEQNYQREAEVQRVPEVVKFKYRQVTVAIQFGPSGQGPEDMGLGVSQAQKPQGAHVPDSLIPSKILRSYRAFNPVLYLSTQEPALSRAEVCTEP